MRQWPDAHRNTSELKKSVTAASKDESSRFYGHILFIYWGRDEQHTVQSNYRPDIIPESSHHRLTRDEHIIFAGASPPPPCVTSAGQPMPSDDACRSLLFSFRKST